MLKSGLTCMLSAMLGGCAIGNVGTLVAHVERRDAVAVVSVHSIGLHGRTRADDLGAHLGYARRVYAFASLAGPDAGWYFLQAPVPEEDAMALDLLVLGLEFAASAPDAGLTLGYSRHRVHARLAASSVSAVGYRGKQLSLDVLTLCSKGNQTCETHPLRH